MATKPTVRIPVWASGGTTTDPGTSKEATGWLISERPPAEWWNWMANAYGQWLDFLADAGPGFSRLDWSSSTPWDDSTPTGFSVQYITDLDTWYVAAIDDVSGDIWVYQSDDGGVTWGTGINLITSGAATVSQFATDGTKLGIIADDTFYLSPSKAISGLVSDGVILASVKAKALIYDATQSVWVAGVDNGTEGRIYTSPATISWTLRETMGASDEISGLGINPAGRAIATCDSTNSFYATDTTGTWSSGGATTGGSAKCGYSQGAGIFWSLAGSANLSFSADGTTWTDTTIDAYFVYDTPDFLFTVDGGSGIGTAYAWRNATDADDFDLELLGEIRRTAFANVVSASSLEFAKNIYEGNSGAMIWPWSTTFKQATMRWR